MNKKAATCVRCNREFIPSSNSSGKYCSQACYQSVPKKRGDLVERFWRYVQKSESCWLWMGPLKEPSGLNTYGTFKIATGTASKQKSAAAHRFSWELHFGNIPDGLQVCHHCDTPRCVNPSHLFLGTHADNASDCLAKGRRPRVNRKNRGEGHGMHRLSEEQVRQIRALYRPGRTMRSLADQFGVSVTAVCVIINRRYWRHI